MTTPDDPDSASADSFPIVGVGASAGGLEAFTQLLRHLPGDTGLACVLVQHLHPTHASHLVDLLGRISAMTVVEAQEGCRVARQRIYVIPPNTLLRIEQGVLRLGARAEGRGLQMPIDHFFTALADDRGSQAIGVVLSGMGSDGTLGLKAIKASGGITFAQDQSALHQSMPASAVASGCVDYVLSPDDIARELIRISQHPYVNGGQPSPTPVSNDAPNPGEALGTLFRLLRQATRIDYANYKRSTVQRRIQRRLLLHKLQSLEDYVAFVRDNPAEIQALHEDILIHVTSFFRDPETFAALGRSVFPRLLEDRPPELPIRLWVPGCSTGEEVYSLAICLLESLGERAASTPIKIFATDVNESALERARAGRYLENSLTEVSPERLRRFFLRDDGGYQIVKSVRELCIFARHDATHDPPFSSIDLISCRNVLIYLGTVLQKRVLPLFHYSLRDGGYLLLGASETIGGLSDLFHIVDPQCRIYTRKATPQRLAPDFALGAVWRPEIGAPAQGTREVGGALDVQREADRVVFSRYTPPGVIVNDDLEVLQFRGHNDHVLAHPPGVASLNLLRLAREGLLLDLRAALDEARTTNATVSRENVRVAGPKGLVHVHVRVTPISVAKQRCFVVVFEENAAPRSEPPPRAEADEADAQMFQLQQELSASRDYLQAIIEEQEATNEELRAANEEIVSSNEELQSTNEELQTAKEELQAANEELSTVNEELQRRNRESTQLSDDLTNLIRSTNIPIVMVGQDLRIRRFSPSATEILSLLATDVGRPLADIRCRLMGVALEQCVAEVIDTLATQERDVQDERGRWLHLLVRPYRTQENRIDGAVIAAVDVDEVKNGELRLRTILDNLPVIVFATDERLASTFWNKEAERVLGWKAEDMLGNPEANKLLTPDDNYRERNLAEFRRRGRDFRDWEWEHTCKDGSGRIIAWSNVAERVPIEGWVNWGVGIDVTERKQAEAALRASEERFRAFMDNSPAIGWMKDEAGKHVYLSKTYETRFGVRLADWLGKTDFDLWPRDIAEVFRANDQRVLATGQTIEVVEETQEAGRRCAWLNFKFLIQDTAGRKFVGGIGIDVTDQRRAEAALRASEARYRAAFEASLVGMCQADPASSRLLRVNRCFCDMLGYPEEELLARTFVDITHPDDRDARVAGINSLVRGEQLEYRCEKRYLRKDGAVIWGMLTVSLVRDENQRPLHTVAVVLEITDRKQFDEALQASEKNLRAALSEKELLLREVHHRVKNNLALVASLLNMQAGEVPDSPVVDTLRDSQNRIHALALVHEFLQQSGDMVAIDFADYVRTLATNFLSAYGAEPHRIRLRIVGTSLLLSLDEAMPSGLILAELLSNCLKHAFPGERAGEIGVELAPTATGVRLVVKDDGVGYPADCDPQQERSLGLTIVRRLSEQLGGTFAVARLNPGTECVVEFRRKSAKSEGVSS